MPCFMIFWKASEHLEVVNIFEENINSSAKLPTIADQVHRSFTESNHRFVKEAEFELLPKYIQKEYSKDKWVVRELKGLGSYWDKNNAIIIVPSISERRAALKHADKMDFGGKRDRVVTKNCLITVGATAVFPELIHAALRPECLAKFKKDGFTRITFQCGDSLNYFHELAPKDAEGLDLVAFGFKKEGLHQDIFACKEVRGVSEEGLAISHAGAGSILDVMRMGVPLIVVPNPSLLDNHQEELAIELQRQGYVTYSDCKGLVKAIEEAGKLAKKGWGGENNTGGVHKVADRILGYEDDASARMD